MRSVKSCSQKETGSDSARCPSAYWEQAPKNRGTRILLAAAMALAVLPGCGYSLRPPYDTSQIQTVYVPVFKSITFARNINLRLTELVQKEIENRTPYKVVGSPESADATLWGDVVYVDRNLWLYNPNNLPRQLQQSIQVNVRFVNNHTQREFTKEIPPVGIVETAPMFPELGETSELGEYKAMQKIAEQIVGMMERPWEGGQEASSPRVARPWSLGALIGPKTTR